MEWGITQCSQWNGYSCSHFCQAMITIFSIITLPVEYDASNRAIVWLQNAGVAQQHELEGANDALKWAARTYLVSAIAAITYSHTIYLCFLEIEINHHIIQDF
ncbi:MAG: hypothetical protein CM15mP23_11900 [Cryomorphaceae bacterium]|nr:MAG: hypothetical protein CM15mP23_11900 [Cryomorphaceae bacterium]